MSDSPANESDNSIPGSPPHTPPESPSTPERRQYSTENDTDSYAPDSINRDTANIDRKDNDDEDDDDGDDDDDNGNSNNVQAIPPTPMNRPGRGIGIGDDIDDAIMGATPMTPVTPRTPSSDLEEGWLGNEQQRRGVATNLRFDEYGENDHDDEVNGNGDDNNHNGNNNENNTLDDDNEREEDDDFMDTQDIFTAPRGTDIDVGLAAATFKDFLRTFVDLRSQQRRRHDRR